MRLRILTYNVHKCIGGLDRRYEPDRVREVIAHYAPDIVFLQEVDSGALRSRGDRQVDLLGSQLGMSHRSFFPNVSLKTGGAYGNAILSHHPILESSNIDLTIPLKKRRSVLHARCTLRGAHGGTSHGLHVFNLHLGLQGFERKMQLRRFLASAPFSGIERHTPVVVAGDFNDVWGTLGRKVLLPAGFRGLARPIRTFPAYAPWRPLDSIFVRGNVEFVRVFRARHASSSSASDHLPLVADLELS
jgi:endonuclease/exonuclease/phosphatase family metal-dependent hydrolase